MSSIREFSCDVLIIGSGAAGLSIALRLPSKYNLIILSKGIINESSTFYAQGGIAAAFDENDSIISHVKDTIKVGAGIVDKDVAEFVASNARHCILWLINQGVAFDMQIQSNKKENYHLTNEGGHSHRRILHTGDATGKEVEMKLVSKTIKCPNIQIFEHFNAIDLITSDKIGLPGKRKVLGAWAWNILKRKTETFQAKIVVLATGGASKVYQYTTNPDIVSGDGIAMAWRAGCRIANLEFNQFHPTALFHPKARNFLLTEALRGEGAYLKRPDGSQFIQDFDNRGELAPRDIVTRAIDYEIKRLGVDCMYLDISHKPANFIHHHFPNIYKKLLLFGIDITRDPIPVVPAAHYTCGGVVVDNHGRTDIDGLYAIGEVSYTGLHGANRIASNSLLECLVYGWSAAKDISKRILYESNIKNLPKWNKSLLKDADELAAIKNNYHELRTLMWNYAGIVRTNKRLELALRHISLLQQEINEYYNNFSISNNLLELRNLVQVSELIVRCAIMRKESRGIHYTLDYPETLVQSGPSILLPTNYSSIG